MGQNDVKTYVNVYRHLYNGDRVFCGCMSRA